MASNKTRSSIDEKLAGGHDESLDLEASIRTDHLGLISPPSFDTPSRFSLRRLEEFSILQKFLCYPSPSTLKLRPTSWLDGVRGVAALGVYIFHAMGCWAPIVSAWHADAEQTLILQFPLIRTIFVSGQAAVSVFFVLSGYVLTHKSLKWMRTGSAKQIYPSVASSMFRRGFRLYIPPILLTFCEMLATRAGYVPPLNFTFQFETSFAAQFLDWIVEMNQFINPFYTFKHAVQGFAMHPKYDAVVWTIPLEFYGSFVCYTLLLFLATFIPNSPHLRMGFVAIFSIFCMVLGSWNFSCFSAGMLLADFNLGQEDNQRDTTPKHTRLWTAVFAIAFYIAGLPTLMPPEAQTNPMPGFETIRTLTPMRLPMEDPSRFWWSLSGIFLLLSISQLPRLKSVFESAFCQYLGKISFSLYLMHEFCLVLFGLGIQKFMLAVAGVESRANTLLYWILCAVWYLLFTVTVFALAAQVERWVDAPSVRFARWLEGRCLKWYKSLR